MRKLTILLLSAFFLLTVPAKSAENSIQIAEPYATLKRMWVTYDIMENGMKGMRIHLDFSTYNMRNIDAYVAIYFEFDDEYGGFLKDRNSKYNSTDGDVAVYKSIRPSYDNTDYNDLTLFMPYSELDLDAGSYDLSMDVKIIYKAGGVISRLNNYPFSYTEPASSSGNVSTSNITVTFEDMWVDYDVTDAGKKGMRIHVKFSVNNMRDIDGFVAIYFEKKNGDKILSSNSTYRSKDGNLAVYKSIRPSYTETVYKDLQLFMPYSEFDLPAGKYDLKMDVDVIMKNGDLVKHMKYHDFWFEH